MVVNNLVFDAYRSKDGSVIYATYLPKMIYKFMKPEFLKQLMDTQEFFINHLNNYPEEKLGREVGDDTEGTFEAGFKIDNYTFNSSQVNPYYNPNFEKALMQSGFIGGIDNVVNLSISNSTFTNRIVDNNYYVYCMCLDNNKVVKEKFGGSTLIIEDFPNFALELNKSLSKIGIGLFASFPCLYVPNREKYFTEKDSQFYIERPFLMKQSRYEYQRI